MPRAAVRHTLERIAESGTHDELLHLTHVSARRSERRHRCAFPQKDADVYALCQFLPGPNIVNLTAVFGSRMRGEGQHAESGHHVQPPGEAEQEDRQAEEEQSGHVERQAPEPDEGEDDRERTEDPGHEVRVLELEDQAVEADDELPCHEVGGYGVRPCDGRQRQ